MTMQWKPPKAMNLLIFMANLEKGIYIIVFTKETN